MPCAVNHKTEFTQLAQEIVFAVTGALSFCCGVFSSRLIAKRSEFALPDYALSTAKVDSSYPSSAASLLEEKTVPGCTQSLPGIATAVDCLPS